MRRSRDGRRRPPRPPPRPPRRGPVRHPRPPSADPARGEHHLDGIDDLDATIERLVACRDAGAEVGDARGWSDVGQVRRIAAATATAVSCLLLPGGPSAPELAAGGVRRVPLGSGPSSLACGTVVQGARHVLDHGVADPDRPVLAHEEAVAAFAEPDGAHGADR